MARQEPPYLSEIHAMHPVANAMPAYRICYLLIHILSLEKHMLRFAWFLGLSGMGLSHFFGTPSQGR